jgi:phage terminase small subunit
VGAGDSARCAPAKSLAALLRPQILNVNSPGEERVENFRAMAAGRQTQVLFEAEPGINQTKV